MKRFFGFLMIVFAILFSLATFNMVGTFASTLVALLRSSETPVDSYDTGYALGQMLAFVILLASSIFLWIFGLRWAKKPKT